ncbi:MAG: pyrroline-5-carboxylate reductase [Candidatus Marinimicrobia bacterium]|nr:pyrroline-5-carboxylate reductase [Candidatus Neomarinimicrobiota bacterium]
MQNDKIAIIGAGNIGIAIASGLADSGRFKSADIILTRRRIHLLKEMQKRGFVVMNDNCQAVRQSKVVIIAVEPQQVNAVIGEIASELKPQRHIVISVVTGIGTAQIVKKVGAGITVVRAMPNTAIAVRESMTCLASETASENDIRLAKSIFDTVGKTIVIEEEKMIAATALGACGIAFFLRAIRAASQGGIEIGFHSKDAIEIAAQTARGAATLLLTNANHPEYEIDRVTTPRGCTIAGLNQMEHEGFSSAMIKGITISAERAANLYKNSNSCQ